MSVRRVLEDWRLGCRLLVSAAKAWPITMASAMLVKRVMLAPQLQLHKLYQASYGPNIKA